MVTSKGGKQLKRCSKCSEIKSKSDFCKDVRSKDGLAHRCKTCAHEYMRRYYEQNKSVLIARSKEYRRKHPEKQRERTQRAKFMMNVFKSTCVKCDEDRLYCIDFHHVDPSTKRLNLSTLKWFTNIDDIKAEVAKCICLCKNCHAEFHYLYGIKPTNPVEALDEYLRGEKEDECNVEL